MFHYLQELPTLRNDSVHKLLLSSMSFSIVVMMVDRVILIELIVYL